MKYSKEETAEARTALLGWLKPGDTVYTILRHRARSGMMRSISVVVFRNNEPLWLDWHVARLLEYPQDDRHEGIKVGGCGMDMGYHIVYSLAFNLWAKDGYKCLGDRCQASIHVNGPGKAESVHKDGYALNHRWL